MKKSILITLLISTALLVGCSKNEETKTSSNESSSALASSTSSESSSSESSASSSEAAETTELKMNLAEVEQGNFESIQGTWENAEGESFTISADSFIVNDNGETNEYKLIIFTEPTGKIRLQASGFPAGFELAQRGTSFPDFSDGPDLTDTTKDRILISQGPLTQEAAQKRAYYRQ